jgi:hypothetical protein
MGLRADVFVRDALAATVGGLVMVTVVADRLNPPAYAIADRYSTLAAILVAATAITAIVMRGKELGREGRLAAVIVLLATVVAWYSGRMWVHEKQFDYLVAQQKAELTTGGIELSGDILNFLRERGETAPPAPRPATWDRDEAAVFRYEDETVRLYDAQFGMQVRRTRDLFSLRGLTDRDLDAFYRRPSNAFGIGVVARRLAALSHRLEKR